MIRFQPNYGPLHKLFHNLLTDSLLLSSIYLRIHDVLNHTINQLAMINHLFVFLIYNEEHWEAAEQLNREAEGRTIQPIDR